MRKDALDGDRLFVVHECLDGVECRQHIARSEDEGYGEATINTVRGVMLRTEVRNNARLIADDAGMADRLWQRMRPFIPAAFEGWRAVGLNERFRFYRYDPGQKFAPHFDGSFERASDGRSQLTCLWYLNDGYDGGETKFYGPDRGQPRFVITPREGMALVFAHQQLHEGAPVLKGRKYVLRTDVMYSRRLSEDDQRRSE